MNHMKKWICFIILLLTCVILSGCHATSGESPDTSFPLSETLPVPYPTVTPTFAPTAESDCQQVEMRGFRLSYPSGVFQNVVDYRVFLPDCLSGTRESRLPVLILLHGMVPGTELMNDSQWDDMGVDEIAESAINDGLIPPLILVLPDGNDMAYGSDESKLATALINEIFPEISRKFCGMDEAWGRALGGLSRGGFWALSTGFQYPEAVYRIGGHSPFLYDGGDFPGLNPFNMVETVLLPSAFSVAIDHGRDDYTAENAAIFVDRLRAAGVNPLYTVYPEGTHDESYWAAHLLDYLLYYAEEWPDDPDAYPPCSPEA